MITEQHHLKIIRHFRPDWGRTTRECETCGGRGHDFDPNKKYDDAVLAIKNARDCPDCNGTGTVFREWETCPACFGNKTVGQASVTQLVPKKPPCSFCRGEGRVPDEAGRGLIAEAVRDFYYQSGIGVADPLKVWGEREKGGRLENFVLNYQKQLPSYDEEWLRLLKAELGNRYWSVSRRWKGVWFYDAEVAISGKVRYGEGRTELEALEDAVRAAKPSP